MLPDLGKYSLWVLSAYGVSLGLLVAIVLLTWARARRVRHRLDAAEKGRADG